MVAVAHDQSIRMEPLQEQAQAPTVPMATVGAVHIEQADVLTRYEWWPQPMTIVSDGAYGLGLFPGDPKMPTGLPEWYEPHIEAWARCATPQTTLWFWNNEIGWATVHPILVRYGWVYRALHVWNKGVAHVAGNVNSKSIRRFPVVTEVCAQYVRDVQLPTNDGQQLSLRDWLRHEWGRTGLPFSKTNEACNVIDAATRKYFTKDHLWYFPPPEAMMGLVAYAAQHGRPTDWPYFSIDGYKPVTAGEWEGLRAKWRHTHAITNVWGEPALRGDERIKDHSGKIVHANQKPLRLLRRIIVASSDMGDEVWEPFGGLCSVAVAALQTGRGSHSAEVVPYFYQLARERLLNQQIEQLPLALDGED